MNKTSKTCGYCNTVIWEGIIGSGSKMYNCKCRDSSDLSYFVKPEAPENVIISEGCNMPISTPYQEDTFQLNTEKAPKQERKIVQVIKIVNDDRYIHSIRKMLALFDDGSLWGYDSIKGWDRKDLPPIPQDGEES